VNQLLRLIDSDGSAHVAFYKRFKSAFITFHSSIYDQPYNCNSHVVSYVDHSDHNQTRYGKIIVFLSTNDERFAFVEKYIPSPQRMSNYVELAHELHHRIDKHFPLLTLSNSFTLVPMSDVRHKCISIPMVDCICLSEIRIDHDHD
jgi:hypothetical protein